MVVIRLSFVSKEVFNLPCHQMLMWLKKEG